MDFVKSTIPVAAMAAIVSFAPAPAAGQARNQQPVVTGPAPRMADGKPDLTGLWRPQPFSIDISKALKPGSEISPKPWAAKLMAERLSKDDPEANCLPSGVPRVAPYPWRVVQTPDRIFFLFEANIHSYRQIFMNRSSHLKDLNPTWYGDSIGRWEGDTLVVDTVGFNDKFWFDFMGRPHTEQLHTVERYRRPGLGVLEEEVTVEDPEAYTKPFTLVARMALMPNQELFEYVCNENNKDVEHILGKEGRDVAIPIRP